MCSSQRMEICGEMLTVFQALRLTSQFSRDEDWIFASPVKLGGLPISYPNVWKVFREAAANAGIGLLGTHSIRDTYRS